VPSLNRWVCLEVPQGFSHAKLVVAIALLNELIGLLLHTSSELVGLYSLAVASS
jgi:hypothetical protein